MPGGLYPPPSVVESWPKPNYVDPVTQGPALIIISIVFGSLSLAIVTARIYSRIFITKAPGIDDILAVIAVAFSIPLSVLLVIQQKTWFTGHHTWDIPIDKFSGQRKNVYICEWCYLTATCAVKISILLFYRRLSVTFSKIFLIATWVGIVYNVLYWITFVVCLLALFKPIEAYWLSFDPAWAATHHYSHGDESWSLPTAAALSVVGDFYSTVLPLMLIRFLDLPQRQKAALYALFGLGFLVVAAGIVRTVIVERVIAKTYDTSWELWENWIWVVVEVNVAILAASAPALKPFFRRFLIDPLASSGRRASYAYGSRRRSSAAQSGVDKRFKWSNTETVHDSNVPADVEKMGIPLKTPQSKAAMIEEEIDDGVSMRRYQLRTSRDGKMVPVQINEQSNFDARSLHTAKSSDAILAPGTTTNFDASPEPREYQHRQDATPVLDNRQEEQYALTDLDSGQPRPQGRSHTQDSGIQGRQGPFDPVSSHSNSTSESGAGSVAVARARAKAQQRESAYRETHARSHTRSISRGSDMKLSRPSTTGGSPYMNMFSGDGNEGSRSSEETIGLPRMGSRSGERESEGVGYAV